jgi:hypothetical protein
MESPRWPGSSEAMVDENLDLKGTADVCGG